MTEWKQSSTDYIGYEYKDKIVPASLVSLYLDCYPCFGWEEDPNGAQYGGVRRGGEISLRFRRNRKICNKTELTRLQRNFDGCVSEIEYLERSKFSAATIWSLVVGLIGTAFMAGSVFAITAEAPMVVLSIILAIPGFIGWAAAYFVYKKVLHHQAEKVAVLIEEKYDELHAICEKGKRLLF
ncbi:hypothetical protein [Anaerotignum sp.]